MDKDRFCEVFKNDFPHNEKIKKISLPDHFEGIGLIGIADIVDSYPCIPLGITHNTHHYCSRLVWIIPRKLIEQLGFQISCFGDDCNLLLYINETFIGRCSNNRNFLGHTTIFQCERIHSYGGRVLFLQKINQWYQAQTEDTVRTEKISTKFHNLVQVMEDMKDKIHGRLVDLREYTINRINKVEARLMLHDERLKNTPDRPKRIFWL